MIQNTSIKAYKEVGPKISERYESILQAITELCIRQNDCTDQEIKEHLNKPDANFVRPRRFELVNKLKRVAYSQTRKCKVTGKTALAWRIL